MDSYRRSRRRLLAGVALGVALAGCADGSGANGDDPADGTDAGTPGEGATEDGGIDGESAPDLDLREANVVGVEIDGVDGSVTFDVTLHHDDAGEEGYANWWQVERLDGTRLDRRDLLHPHAEQPFTRSETVAIPEGVTCLVVRGHDETHGYGGVAALVDTATGETRAVDQGPEPRSFDEDDCP